MRAQVSSERGSAILSVTFLGVLMVALAAGLIAVTVGLNRESYVLNKQLVCRYAAEGALQEVAFQIKQDDYTDVPGWFDRMRVLADPVEVKTIPDAATTTPPTADTSTVEIRIYDRAEADAQLGISLTSDDDYIVEIRATSDEGSYTAQMRVHYEVETITQTEVKQLPTALFSKYALWIDGGGRLIPSSNTGYVHANGNISISDPYDRFGLPLTAEGTISLPSVDFADGDGNGIHDLGEGLVISSGGNEHVDLNHNGVVDPGEPRARSGSPNYADLNGNGSRDPGEPAVRSGDVSWESLFDFDRNGVLDAAPRAQFGDLSEADAEAMSGGNQPAVNQPQYVDIDTDLRTAAEVQAAAEGSTPGTFPYEPFNIDSANALYSGIGALQDATVAFSHSALTGLSTATVTVQGSSGTVTNNVLIPPGKPLLIYSTPRISSLAGSLYGQVTVASAYGGSGPSITVTDHLVLVDQNGTPKAWMHDNGSPIPQPAGRNFNGIPVDNATNLDNMDVSWAPPQYTYQQPAGYDPDTVPVLGVLGRDGIHIEIPSRNAIIQGAFYTAEPGSQIEAVGTDSAHNNIGVYGSRVSPGGLPFGIYERIYRTYDPDMLTTPPPYWIAPAGTTTTTTSTFEVQSSYGAIYEKGRRF